MAPCPPPHRALDRSVTGWAIGAEGEPGKPIRWCHADAGVPLPPPRRACDVLCLRGRGLVVICSCSHCGLINTIRQAMAVSGVDKLHAVLGGFHLEVRAADYVEHTRPRRGPGCCSPRGL